MIIVLFNFCYSFAQEKDNSEQLIMGFLQKISSYQYKPSLKDFELFFDRNSIIEMGLRSDSIKSHPDAKLSYESTNTSFAIENLLKNKTMRHLIDLKNNNNYKWIIFKSYKYGSATMVYEIGVENSNDFLKFKMVNWAYRQGCGIDNILDENDKSVLY